MAINLITGRPGSGKSYEAVAFHVLPRLQDGRHIVTNLPLNREAFAQLDPEYAARIHVVVPTGENPIPFYRDYDYTQYEGLKSEKGVGPLYVVDEAHMAIPAGNKNSDRTTLEWYAVHRHSATDVLLITQNANKLHKYVTALIEVHVILSKNTALGSVKSYRRSVRDGCNGQQVGTIEVKKYKPEFFKLYSTHMREGGVEANTKGKTIFSHWVFRYAMPAMFLACFWAFSRLDMSVFDSAEEKRAKQEQARSMELRKAKRESFAQQNGTSPQPSLVPESAQVVPPAPELTGFPLEGATFVISGNLYNGDGNGLYFLTARLTDGRVVRMTSQDLRAVGYKVEFPKQCVMKYAYSRDGLKFESVAFCGQIRDLPPIYYLDPNTLQGRNSLSNVMQRQGAGLPTAPLAQALVPRAVPATPQVGQVINPTPVTPQALDISVQNGSVSQVGREGYHP